MRIKFVRGRVAPLAPRTPQVEGKGEVAVALLVNVVVSVSVRVGGTVIDVEAVVPRVILEVKVLVRVDVGLTTDVNVLPAKAVLVVTTVAVGYLPSRHEQPVLRRSGGYVANCVGIPLGKVSARFRN